MLVAETLDAFTANDWLIARLYQIRLNAVHVKEGTRAFRRA